MNNHTENKARNSVVLNIEKQNVSNNGNPNFWNGSAVKPDIRNVHSVHNKESRDIAVTANRRQGLKEVLARLYEGIDGE